ncbi:COG2 protein, partial [Polypterus senegalus]
PNGLQIMYGRLLEFVPHHCRLLREVTSGAIASDRADTVPGYDFLVNSVWPEMVRGIEEKLPSIFNPGNPDAFHEVLSKASVDANKDGIRILATIGKSVSTPNFTSNEEDMGSTTVTHIKSSPSLSTHQIVYILADLDKLQEQEIPAKASVYIDNALKPLCQLRSDYKDILNPMVIQDWLRGALSNSIQRYFETVSDVLSSVKKMEESLKRLKQARKTVTSSSTGANGGLSDDNKIRLQLALDVEYLGEQTIRGFTVHLEKERWISCCATCERTPRTFSPLDRQAAGPENLMGSGRTRKSSRRWDACFWGDSGNSGRRPWTTEHADVDAERIFRNGATVDVSDVISSAIWQEMSLVSSSFNGDWTGQDLLLNYYISGWKRWLVDPGEIGDREISALLDSEVTFVL